MKKNGRIIKCKRCGKECYRRLSVIKKQNFCSRNCHDEFRKTKKLIKCAQCGKDHYRSVNRVWSHTFCSQICQYKFQRTGKLVSCVQCGKQIYKQLNRRRSHNFCSRKCSAEFFKGSQASNWQGGISQFRGLDWNIVRKQVYVRDNYTCQICGRTKCAIHAHHIVPYRVSQDNSLANLIALCISCHQHEEHKYYRILKQGLTV